MTRSGPRFSVFFPLLLGFVLLCMTTPGSSAQMGSGNVQAVLNASPDPSYFEENIILSLMITPPTGGPSPGGTVQFAVDGVAVGPLEPVQNNLAEYIVNTPLYATGLHTVTAAYSGDTNYAPDNESVQQTIIKLRSQTALTIKTPTIFYGQLADAVAQVTPVDSAPDATLNGGTIVFLLDGRDICDIQITGGPETCPDSAGRGIDAGMHVLIANYTGNQYYDSSTSSDGPITVLPDDTAMSLSTSLSPSTYGQAVTFSAKVTAPYATPVGPVAFYDGVTLIGTGTLDASGTATVSTSTLTIGSHSITARYAATLDFNASNSTPIQQIVVLPPPAPVGTATVLTSSINPSAFGQSVTFTASVATTGAFLQIPTGTVAFLDGVSVLGTATLDAAGRAQFTTSTLAIGQHTMTVSYAGTSAFAANASGPLVQVVTTPLTSAGNGFLLTVTPTSFAVGVGNYVSLSVNVLPLNGFNEAVHLSCTGVPAETQCLFDTAILPAGGGNTRLTVNPAAPHDCGNDKPYFISAQKGELLPFFLGLGLLFSRRARKRLLRCLALLCLLALLPLLGGCGHCTDLGVRPDVYTFSVQGTSTGSASITHAVTMKMNVHL